MVRGDDDFFSTDLTDDVCAAVWSRFTKPLLLVPSAQDEHYSGNVPYDELLQRWKSHCQAGVVSDFSGPVPGANHTVGDEVARVDLAKRIVGFLKTL